MTRTVTRDPEDGTYLVAQNGTPIGYIEKERDRASGRAGYCGHYSGGGYSWWAYLDSTSRDEQRVFSSFKEAKAWVLA